MVFETVQPAACRRAGDGATGPYSRTGAAAEALHARRTIARARAHKEHDAYRRHDCVAVE
jgi:hypothetical protein